MDNQPTDHESTLLLRAWRGALAVFILAGSTGALFRLAAASGDTFGLDPTNVRHAHSHLMYFGWATPALFALIAARLPGLGGGELKRIGPILGATFVFALVAYPAFLLFGYKPALIGDARLPFGVMAAGLNVLAWYAFVASYWRARRGASTTLAFALYDLAVLFLVLATLGAWGLPVLQFTGGNLALKTALTHLFLDLFSEGWFVFGVLGLAATDARSNRSTVRWAVRIAALGVPFTFALGMPVSMVAPGFGAVARIGAALVGAGLCYSAVTLAANARGLWRLALVLLATKAAGQLAVAVGFGAGWSAVPGFRILYLHLMLLGFVTLGLVAAARSEWGEAALRPPSALALSVGVLLLSLVLLTPLWPSVWSGAWVLWAVFGAALGPVAAVAWALARANERSVR